MGLSETIIEQMKTAMKAGEKLRLETLRSLRAGILEFEKSGVERKMTPEDEQKLLITAAKKRQDSIEQFANAGRTEAAEKERAELTIIREFLPKQLTSEETEEHVKVIIAEIGATSAKDFGKVMGIASKALRGQADGTMIQQIVKRLLV